MIGRAARTFIDRDLQFDHTGCPPVRRCASVSGLAAQDLLAQLRRRYAHRDRVVAERHQLESRTKRGRFSLMRFSILPRACPTFRHSPGLCARFRVRRVLLSDSSSPGSPPAEASSSESMRPRSAAAVSSSARAVPGVFPCGRAGGCTCCAGLPGRGRGSAAADVAGEVGPLRPCCLRCRLCRCGRGSGVAGGACCRGVRCRITGGANPCRLCCRCRRGCAGLPEAIAAGAFVAGDFGRRNLCRLCRCGCQAFAAAGAAAGAELAVG